MKKKIKDRRKTKRLIFELPVEVSGPARRKKTRAGLSLHKTRDLSSGGLFLYTDKKIKPDSQVVLDIDAASAKKHFELLCKVIWAAKKKTHPVHYPGVGLEISKMLSGNKKDLSKFLRQKMSNYKDAQSLHNMYINLKNIAAQLVEIEERHKKFNHFRKAIEAAICELDDVAHIIDKEVIAVRKL